MRNEEIRRSGNIKTISEQEDDGHGWAASLEWTIIQTHALQSPGYQMASEIKNDHVKRGSGHSKGTLTGVDNLD